MIGRSLGQYRVVARLGEGGMGQVYRAEDTRLRRDVAIKVLPPDLARDAERLARLEREAQSLAALNHPHVAAIYGLEEAQADGGTTSFLVMELVEGQSLADRVLAGPMAPDEVVRIGRAIAEGLEAAHEKGIVHRDLKPANVMLGESGSIKVLDFGLAKAAEGEAGDASGDLANSPTTMGTQMGVILGTASYMSPEQARGRVVDKRTDIWAFGCVLFEMLGGRRPFDGDTVTDIIAAVVRAEPDEDALPSTTPPRLRALVRRCLEKEPRQRLRDIGDARIELEHAFEPLGTAPVTDAAGTGARRLSPTVLAAAAAGGVALGAIVMFLLRPSLPIPPVRQATLVTEGALPSLLAVSPGVDALVYQTTDGMRLRRLADGSESPIEARGVSSAAFGPDGLLYLVENGALRRMDVRGGSGATLAPAPEGGFAFLTVGDEEAFLLRGQPPATTYLDAVNVSTGAVRQVGEWSQEAGPFIPTQVVSGGDAVLGMSIARPAGLPNLGDFSISVVDTRTGVRRDLTAGYAWPRLVDGSTLLMVDPQTRIVSVPVDSRTFELGGVPVPRIEGLSQLQIFAAFDVASDGSLFYIGGDAVAANERTLDWLDRQGQPTPISEKANFYDTDSTISPDGRYLALERSDLRRVWIHDLERDTQTPLWRDTINSFPVWSPDGARVAVAAQPQGEPAGIYLAPADGSTAPVRLTSAAEGRFHLPMDWSGDGRIIYVDSNSQTRGGPDVDLWIVDAVGGAEPQAFLSSDAREVEARFSPDSRWVAYESSVTGTPEVYVRAADGTGGAIPISSDGGNRPSWNPRGGELFFMRGRTLMAVDVTTSGRFNAGVARELFTLPDDYQQTLVEPDRSGDRFLAVKLRAFDDATRLIAIFNWAQTLSR